MSNAVEMYPENVYLSKSNARYNTDFWMYISQFIICMFGLLESLRQCCVADDMLNEII